MILPERIIGEYGKRGKGFSQRENSLLKFLKAIHILSATAWGGGALAMQALSFLRLSSPEPEFAAHVAQCAHFVDSCVVMPGLAGCALTGLIYSVFTAIGFFKFAWIGYKWLITISAGFWGTMFWGPWGNALISDLAPYGLDWPLRLVRACILPETMREGLLQTLIILSMCLVSVYRPLSFRFWKRDANKRLLAERIGKAYGADRARPWRAPQDNPQVRELYNDWLDGATGEKSKEMLKAKWVDKSGDIRILKAAGVYPPADHAAPGDTRQSGPGRS